MLEPRSSFVAADDIRLHYLEWEPEYSRKLQPALVSDRHIEMDNSDNIPIVLLHGLGATADTWRLVAEYLCPQHLVLGFDQRGHGQSDQPASGYDLVTISEDIICSMATLGLGQVAVIGHGWGARVALVLAARHPALVSHLVLVDCPHIEPRHWPGMTRERFVYEHSLTEVYASRESYLRTMRHEMADFWSPEVEAIVLTYIRELPDGSVEGRLSIQQQHQVRESLWEDRALSYYGKLACPVLLVPAAAEPHADGEISAHLEQTDEFEEAKGQMARQVARVIQRCTVLWMPATAHDIQLQHPQMLATAIATFLQE